MEILEKVFEVYEDSLPVGTSEYSANTVSPVTVLQIKKQFKTYENFKLEYAKFCIAKRNEKAKEEVITKPVEQKVNPKVTEVTK